MPSTTTTIGTAVATTTKIVQLKHVNQLTTKSPILDAVIDDAIEKRALSVVSIEGRDTHGAAVLTARIGITYSESGPEFNWLGQSPEIEFWMKRDNEKLGGPARQQSLCQAWRGVLEQIMEICHSMEYQVSWSIQLEGPYAPDIRARHGLSTCNRPNRATQQVGDTLINSHSDDMTLTVFMDPEVANQAMPGNG